MVEGAFGEYFHFIVFYVEIPGYSVLTLILAVSAMFPSGLKRIKPEDESDVNFIC